MSILIAVIFGAVQGFTEFLPLSSSAHLSVLSNLFGISSSGFNMNAFSVFVHFGTILAVVILYFADFGEILFQTLEFLSGATPTAPVRGGTRFPSVRLLMLMLCSILPLFLVLPFNKYLTSLNEDTIFIGVMLIASGGILEAAEHLMEGKKTEKSMTLPDAVIFGLCQFVSAIPGISRTGTGLTAGLALGLKKEFAMKFTLMLSVPVMLGAELIRLVKAMQSSFALADVPPCLCGMAASLLAGIGAIKLLGFFVDRGKYHGFAYYCFVAGVLSIILTMIF